MGGDISVGTVTSGGITLTLQAAGPIALGTLTSTGGDVDMTSTASTTITGGTVVAYGSDNFAAYGNNIGPSVTSQTGSITLSSQVGIVDWGLVNAATSFTANGGGGVVVNQGTATTTFTATSRHGRDQRRHGDERGYADLAGVGADRADQARPPPAATST